MFILRIIPLKELLFFTQAFIEAKEAQKRRQRTPPIKREVRERECEQSCFLCQCAGERKREILFCHLPITQDICLSPVNRAPVISLNKETQISCKCANWMHAVHVHLQIMFWHLHHSDARVCYHSYSCTFTISSFTKCVKGYLWVMSWHLCLRQIKLVSVAPPQIVASCTQVQTPPQKKLISKC